MGTEHPCRISFALADGSGVAKQRAEGSAFDPHVGAEQVLAVEVEERTPDGRFEEGDAALVAGGCRGIFAVAVIARQCSREGREEVAHITFDRGNGTARQKIRDVVEQPDELVGKRRHLDRNRVSQIPVRHQKDRNLGVPASEHPQKFGGLFVCVLFVVTEGPVEENAMDRGIGHHDCKSVLNGQCFNDLDPADTEFLGQRTHCSAARRGHLAQLVIHYQSATRQRVHRTFVHGVSPGAGTMSVAMRP